MPSCPSCGETTSENAKFCPECGAPQAASCLSCGAPVTGKFCAECGTPVSGAANSIPQQNSASPRVAERRVTSVLFGDLVGFTTLSESRDPEEVRELLSRYFATARTVMERYGGTVEKFIGDAVMAVWGVPAAMEDDAERAVRAGLDVVAAVVALGEEVGAPELTMRVGIVTGEVAVTLGATSEGMVAGDAVNTAARVQSAAQPGEVWVDDQTRALTQSSVAYADAGLHALKGKSEQMKLFAARQITAVVGGSRRVDGLEAPFAGRDRELRLVKELFHATLEEGRPRLVAVYGAPGVGKTRLGWEFDKYVDGINTTVTAHRGRCLSYGEGVAFWALAELVRGRLGILEGDGTGVVVERLHAGLDEYVPDADDRAWLLPRLATLLCVTDVVAPGASFARDDLFAAWRTFLERVALWDGVSGSFLLIDDLQWADSSLLDFVNHVLDFAQAPIFMLVLARSELADQKPAFAGSKRTSAIHLEPLPEPAMAVVVDGLVDGLPAELRAALVERAEGVPLFAVETVRALIDRDAVIPRDGRYVLAPDAATTIDLHDRSLPTSLHTLVASRLDGLPAEERRVVQDAAVLGHSFSRAGLDALIAAVGDDVDLDAALTSLVRKEIFAIDSDPRSPERGNYRFVQVVVRTVAYDTLAKRDRKSRHLAVAAYLLREPDADTISAIIGSHYVDAHAAAGGGDDASALAARAVELLERAAQQAREVGAPEEALRQLRTALGLASDPETEGRLNVGACRAAMSAGMATDAAAMAETAQAAYTKAGMPVESGRALALWGEAQIYLGLGQSVIERLAEPYGELVGQPGAEEVRAALALGVARSYYINLGQTAESLPWFDRAVELSEALDDVPMLASTLASYGGALVLVGRAHMGLGLLQVSLDLARRTDDPTLQLRPLNNLVSFLATRDLGAAQDYAEAGLAIVRRLGDRDWGRYLIASATHVAWNLGAWDEVLQLVDESAAGPGSESSPLTGFTLGYAAAVRAARGLPSGEMADFGDRATAAHGDVVLEAAQEFVSAARARAAGDIVTAAACSKLAFEHYVAASGIDDDFPLFWWLAVEDQLAAGDVEAAAVMVAVVGDGPHGLVPGLPAAMLPWLHARVAIARGRDDGVAGDLATAVTRLRQFGAPFYTACALLDEAEWLDTHGDVASALPKAAEALEAFRQLEATTWMERAARLTGTTLTPVAPVGT